MSFSAAVLKPKRLTNDPYAGNLISLLHLNGNLVDETGNTWEKNSLAVTSFTSSGKFDGAVDAGVLHTSTYTFRTTSEVSTPISSGDFTMEIWFKTPDVWPEDNGQLWNRLICGVANSEILIWFQARSVPSPRFVFNVGATSVTATGITLQNSTWYHLALVRKSGLATFYVNGISRATLSTTRTIPATNTIYIGANGNSSFYQINGLLDDFRLTAAARYDGTFDPPSSEFPNP